MCRQAAKVFSSVVSFRRGEFDNGDFGRGEKPHLRSPLSGAAGYVNMGVVFHFVQAGQIFVVQQSENMEREYLSAVGMAGDFQVKVVLSAKVGRRVRKQYPIPVVTAFGKGFFQIGIFAVEMTAESIGNAGNINVFKRYAAVFQKGKAKLFQRFDSRFVTGIKFVVSRYEVNAFFGF